MSTPSNSDSDASSTIRKRGFSIPIEEDIEPYVRRRRLSSERNRKRLEKLSEEEQNLLRTSINSRERRRMHDLNDALDELRSVLPYSHGTTARRLSKINTVLLASNCIRNMNTRFADIIAENEQLRAMIPEDKLATIKLQSLQLPTITALLSPDPLPVAAKSSRTPQRLSSSPPPKRAKPDTPTQPTKTSNVEHKVSTTTKTSHSNQTSQLNQLPAQPTPIFPMALLAAATFNFQQQRQSGASPHQTPQLPTFVPPPQLCMKRFNPSAFCLCVGCLMQNGNMNASLQSIRSNR